MADDGVDEDLVAFLRQSLGIGSKALSKPQLNVLKDARFICDNAIDVAIDPASTKHAAEVVWTQMQSKGFSKGTWSSHELHPKAKTVATLELIFTIDLLNFSFWPDQEDGPPFAVEYRGHTWTGYWSLVAALQRALDEGIPITSPDFWQDENEDSIERKRHAFRSDSGTELPLLEERLDCLKQAGDILYQQFDCSFLKCLNEANGSAISLVSLLLEHFPCFRDEARFEGKKVGFYKRAQILAADIWACFEGEGHGYFHDIDTITMFADYRVPQILHSMGCLQYSPSLEYHIKGRKAIKSGHSWEVQLRGCSIWCVELMRKHIISSFPGSSVNAILIDFFLYDTVKALEARAELEIPHHRTRCIWY